MLLSFTAKGPTRSSGSCDVCKEGSWNAHRIKPRGQVMDFGYRLCLIFGFVLVCFFSFSHQLDRLNRDEKLIAVFAQRLSQLSPTQRTTLSHALMIEAFCSTVLLLLPFMHSLALAGAGTHRETRGAWLSCRGLPPTCVCICQVPPSPVTSLVSHWRV